MRNMVIVAELLQARQNYLICLFFLIVSSLTDFTFNCSPSFSVVTFGGDLYHWCLLLFSEDTLELHQKNINDLLIDKLCFLLSQLYLLIHICLRETSHINKMDRIQRRNNDNTLDSIQMIK